MFEMNSEYYSRTKKSMNMLTNPFIRTREFSKSKWEHTVNELIYSFI